MKSKLALLTVGLGLTVWSLPAHAYWAAANGKYCVDVCTAIGSTAKISGTYKNGNPFTICRTNAHQEGNRAGYNLQPSWAAGCWVGWGGQESAYTPYDCLCD